MNNNSTPLGSTTKPVEIPTGFDFCEWSRTDINTYYTNCCIILVMKNGLYEKVINDALSEELQSLDKRVDTGKIDAAEAPRVLADYVAELVKRKLQSVDAGDNQVAEQVGIVNSLIDSISKASSDEPEGSLVAKEAEQLLAVFDKDDPRFATDEKAHIERPETSIAQSSLFTGAVREPHLDNEFKHEILSCDRIDMLVSFIKWSGLRLILDELRQFTKSGGELRIITTSYMGATDIKAIEELSKLNNTKIKVSYDTKHTRLHAKTYVFHRDTGYTTAYVGSSNMSNAALTSGLEWNVKVAKTDLPETIDKIEATFESYWNSNDFNYYDEGQKERLSRALKAEKYHESNNPDLYTVDVRPYSYQQEILDKLAAERSVRGKYRNLIVAATGTGKTIISALDYKRYCQTHRDRPCRLLFIAHREEILNQSLSAFRSVLKDGNFGELFVGGHIPDSIEHVFMSIQTFNSKDYTDKTTNDYYDYIVVDEFHHAAARSYKKLLEYYKPQILLGLTATPERMDGKSVLEYFDNRIAAEIRLPEAIDRKLLCPFQYFGVTDSVNLEDIKWKTGGYDKSELENVYVLSAEIAKRRADEIVRATIKYVTDIDEVKGLGFCVSKKHAEFMSDYFNEHGIPSIYLTSNSGDDERKAAKKKLVSGEIRFIFVVDLYNEGVDIPEVNTVLFLRPTESLTIFLQQLGRGLRLSDNKECLTVLDFIGQANKKYNFEDKFKALLSNTRNGIQREIKNGFTSLPKGCYIRLEKVASEYVLNNIKAAYGSAAAIKAILETFEEDTGKELTLSNFLNTHKMDPRFLYKHGSFSRLCVSARIKEDFSEPGEKMIEKSLMKFAVADSRRWIAFLIRVLSDIDSLRVRDMNAEEQRMMQMLYVTIWSKGADDWDSPEVSKNLDILKDSPIMIEELLELLRYRYDQIDFIDAPVDVGFECPLDCYCTYTRDQLLVAMDWLNPNSMREGVKWLKEKKIDIFLITLNKSDKDYSPTTMYEDYSVNSELFHWQSQSTTSETSLTGRRYINHKEMGSKVLLFVREFKKDKLSGATEPYTYLGAAEYVSHEGSKPMSILWKLDAEIPAKFIRKTNKLMVG